VSNPPLPSSEERAALRLAAIVDSSDDAIVSKDLDGIITSWNKAAERMFGWTSEEVVGKSIRIVIPADRQAEEDQVLGRIRQGLPVEHFETIRQRKDGSQFPISLTVSPIRDKTGRLIGASKIARDITERREAEALAERTSRRRCSWRRSVKR
jgi:PAS domain S-box-containing protein